MKPKVIISLSERFLVSATLIILIICSSIAMIPVRAVSGSKIVYVAICVDSEADGWSGVGSTDLHPTLNAGDYSATVPGTVAAVFDSNFRNSHQDSFGNAFKMSWFAEMDYLIAQSNFIWADGSPAGVSGYTAIRDLLINNWGAQIQTYGDSIEYHHHFVIYDGTWKRYDKGPDAGYPEYQMDALDHMIIDDSFFPSSFRSGWWIMPTALSSWLEQWLPFDYTPVQGIWYPVHPSGMDRWQTRCPYSPNVYATTQAAFAYASANGSAIYSICTHTDENMKYQVDWLQWCLSHWDADETHYPNVSFKYVSAKEAMQLALGFTDFTPPTFTITQSSGTYTIVSSEPLWKNHPYIALKYTNGTYAHISATPIGSNTWTVTPPTSISCIGVAGSDLYGNAGARTATVTQDQYMLIVDTVGSGSVTKSPDQATYASGTVVTLTATPAAGWSFSGWSSGLTGNPASVTITGDTVVTAYFTQIEYTLTVSASPAEGGSVTKNPDLAHYHYDDVVQLTAIPSAGYSFAGWSGDLSGGPASVTITGSMEVTAYFTQNEYSLTVTTAPSSAAGSISASIPGPYHLNDAVTLTPTANLGYTFSSWSGDGINGAGNTRVVTISGNMFVIATFTQNMYKITVIQGANGVISPGTVDVEFGSDRTFTITPDNGFHIFDVIVDGISQGVMPSYLFSNITADHTISAIFAINVYTAYLIVSNSTISELAFNSTSQVLSFTASGPSGTSGFSNVTVSKTLIADVSGLEVYLDGTEIDYNVNDLITHWMIHITYQHGTHKVEVINTRAIPEFPPFFAFAFFMIATLLAIMICKRRRDAHAID